MGCRIDDALQLTARWGTARLCRPGIAEGADMQLDDRRAEGHCSVERRTARLDEERDSDAGPDQLPHIGDQRVVAAHDLQPAPGRPLLTLFLRQPGSMRVV